MVFADLGRSSRHWPTSFLPSGKSAFQVRNVWIAHLFQCHCGKSRTATRCAMQDDAAVGIEFALVVGKRRICVELEHSTGGVNRPRDRACAVAFLSVSYVDEDRPRLYLLGDLLDTQVLDLRLGIGHQADSALHGHMTPLILDQPSVILVESGCACGSGRRGEAPERLCELLPATMDRTVRPPAALAVRRSGP